jgi:hypothetical protein
MTYLRSKMPETPTVEMSVPLFIRVLELVREDVRSDVNLHIILETILALATEDRTLVMDDYPKIAEANPR